MSVATRLVSAWYAPRITPLAAALWPFSLLFGVGVAVRRALYRAGVLPRERLPVPVVVVGNLVVGGSGKTPLVRALAEALAARGWRPGIVSRGYGGANTTPRSVVSSDDTRESATKRRCSRKPAVPFGSPASARMPRERCLPRIRNATSSSATTDCSTTRLRAPSRSPSSTVSASSATA
jgi:hypothetical protein